VTNGLHIAFVVLALTNMTLQVEPHPTNAAWYTNYWGTNLQVSGTAMLQGNVGPTVQLWWKEPATNVFLEWSSDMAQWYAVRVRFLGVTNWYASPLETRFYRLRQQF